MEAIADYNKAIDMNPDFADAYDNRGLTFYKQGSFTQAIVDFNKAIEINPNDSEEYNNRGACYSHQGSLCSGGVRL